MPFYHLSKSGSVVAAIELAPYSVESSTRLWGTVIRLGAPDLRQMKCVVKNVRLTTNGSTFVVELSTGGCHSFGRSCESDGGLQLRGR